MKTGIATRSGTERSAAAIAAVDRGRFSMANLDGNARRSNDLGAVMMAGSDPAGHDRRPSEAVRGSGSIGRAAVGFPE
jgi:hypothetical protein